MKITWVRQVKLQKKDKNQTEESKKPDDNKTQKSDLGSPSKREEEEEQKFVFNVVPESIVLNPKMGIMIEFRANSSVVGKMNEPW